MTRHDPDLGSDASSVWNFCAPFSDDLRPHLAGKPVVESPIVGCFLRLYREPKWSHYGSCEYSKVVAIVTTKLVIVDATAAPALYIVDQ